VCPVADSDRRTRARLGGRDAGEESERGGAATPPQQISRSGQNAVRHLARISVFSVGQQPADLAGKLGAREAQRRLGPGISPGPPQPRQAGTRIDVTAVRQAGIAG